MSSPPRLSRPLLVALLVAAALPLASCHGILALWALFSSEAVEEKEEAAAPPQHTERAVVEVSATDPAPRVAGEEHVSGGGDAAGKPGRADAAQVAPSARMLSYLHGAAQAVQARLVVPPRLVAEGAPRLTARVRLVDVTPAGAIQAWTLLGPSGDDAFDAAARAAVAAFEPDSPEAARLPAPSRQVRYLIQARQPVLVLASRPAPRATPPADE